MRVSSIHVRAAVEAAQLRGVSAETLLSHAGLGVDVLADGYAWLPVQGLDRVMQAAVALTHDPAFGLHWGSRSSMTQFDLASPMVAHAPSLRVAIESLLRFQSILSDRPELLFVERERSAVFHFAPLAVTDEGHRVRADLAVSAFRRMLKVAGVPPSAIFRVTLAHARPSYADEYARVMEREVEFDQLAPSLEFDRGVLDRPLLLGNTELHRALDSQASSLRARLLAQDSFELRLARQIRLALPEIPSMQAVASSLGMSERSLRRRLSELGSSYSAVVEQTRRELACDLLCHPAHGTARVAQALGFANVSAFHRAFKRWTGQTPAEFRDGISGQSIYVQPVAWRDQKARTPR
jgi:AraC-like DNA-binding protein